MDNFKAAFRSLLSTPGPTFVVIATLAIAIGANTAIFSVVDGVLLRPLGYGDDSELVVVWATSGADETGMFRLSPADYRDLRDGANAFGGQIALYRSIGSVLTGLDRPAQVGSLTVTARVFRMLEAQPALGQFFTDADETPGGPRKVVITHASWTNRFGADPGIIGSSIEIDGEQRTVMGVTSPAFEFPPGNREVELYFPMGLSDGVLLDRDHRMFDAMARLDDGVSLESARAELNAIATQLAREYPNSNDGWGLTARSLRTELVGDLSGTLWVLSAAVFLVLLIACANIANVLVVRSAAAAREFAVRAAMGARASDLAKRSLAESSLLGVLGAAIGLMLAYWGVAMLRPAIPADIPLPNGVSIDSGVLLFAAALSIGATVLFGSLPAIRGMAPDLLGLLKPSGTSRAAGPAGQRLRAGMVVIEVALAIVLLVGAGLMVRSFARLSEVDPGFRQEGVVSIGLKMPRSRYAVPEWRPFFERLVERIEALPGVTSAGAVSDLPMNDVGLGYELEFTLPGLDATLPSARPNGDVRLVVPGYFEAMGMTIVAGRSFDSLDADSDRIGVVVNETLAARYFRDIDPIGRTIDVQTIGDVEVLGVVADIRHGGLQAKYESELFIPYGRPISTFEMFLVVHSDLETAAVASAVGDLIAEIDAELAPSQVTAVADLLWQSAAQPRFNTALLSTLALCAAILAIVGTHGIVAYTVAQRTGEIGVRMALGASSAATVSMIVRQALAVVVAGAALGILAALAATRFLGQMLFEVQPTDPLTFGVVALVAVLVGASAAWLPARRATRIDPMVALRSD